MERIWSGFYLNLDWPLGQIRPCTQQASQNDLETHGQAKKENDGEYYNSRPRRLGF